MSKVLKEQQTEWDLHETPETFLPLEFTEEVKPELFGLEISKAQEMTSGLAVTFAEREVLKKSYIEIIELPITSETLPIFKELRLKIVKNRTQGIEKWHKDNKAFYLAGGRFVDAIKNKEILENEQMESKLMEAEKFFENQEKERKSKLNLERIEKIYPYVTDTIGLDLSDMSEYDFDDFLLGKKTRFENDKKEREAEAIRIENQRLAEIEKQKAIEIEYAKLKVEAEAKELQIKKERNEALAKQKAIQDEADKKAREEKAKQDAILKAEQEAREKLEKELQAKKEAELQEKHLKEQAELQAKKEAEKLAKAPIKQQLTNWVDSFKITGIGTEKMTDEQIDISNEIMAKFNNFKNWAKNEIEKL